MPRSKRWPCNSGLHVPMVVYFPAKWQHLAPKEYTAGGKSDRMVSFVDLAPTLLSIIGIKPPEWMQGHAFAGPHQTEPQPFLYGERGRMDERMDLVRSVTDGRYVYLRTTTLMSPRLRKWPTSLRHPPPVFGTSFLKTAKPMPHSPSSGVSLKILRSFTTCKVIPMKSTIWHNLPSTKPLSTNCERPSVLHLAAVRDVCFLPEREIHSRSTVSTPYDIARDDSKYPFEKSWPPPS